MGEGWLGLVGCCYHISSPPTPKPALRDRCAAFQSERRHSRTVRQAQRLQAVDFFNVLTGPELLQKTEALLPQHQEREYPPTVTLATFLKQALSQDRSCQRAVDGWIA